MFIQIKVQNVKQVAFKNPSESIKADEGTFMVVAAQPKVSALIPPAFSLSLTFSQMFTRLERAAYATRHLRGTTRWQLHRFLLKYAWRIPLIIH